MRRYAPPACQSAYQFEGVDYPRFDSSAPLIGAPLNHFEAPGGNRGRPPLLGEHTDELLADPGFGNKAISALKESGVV